MRKIIILILCMGLMVGCSSKTDDSIIEINLTYMLERERGQLLEEAINRLNEKLILEGDMTQLVYVDGHFEGTREQFRNSVLMRTKAEESMDIILMNHDQIPYFVEADALRSVEDVIALPVYQGVYPKIREAGQYQSTYYGVALDTEHRPIWYSKAALNAYGLTDSDIESLIIDVKEGAYTLGDMLVMAENIVGKGITEYGFTHRPRPGGELTMIASQFGNEFTVDESGKLIIKKQPLIKMYEFYNTLVSSGITPAEMTVMTWDDLEGDIWPSGKSAFFVAGIYEKMWIMSAAGMSSDEIDNAFGYFPLPAITQGESPLTLSSPFMWTVSRNVADKKYTYIKRLLEEVAEPESMAAYSVQTYHLPVSAEIADNEVYKNNSFLVNSQYMLDYTIVEPKHIAWPLFNDLLFQGIQAVELSKMSPEEAMNFVIDSMIAEYPEKVLILEY